MKRLFTILLTAIIIVGATDVSAQRRSIAGYHGEIFAAGSYGLSEIATHTLSLHTVQGISFGECLTAGLGFGVDANTISLEDMDSDIDFWVPIYADFKAYAPTRGRVDPFIALDLGGAFSVTSEDLGGLYISSGIGFRAGAFMWSINYRLQQLSPRNSGIAINTHGVQLRLGLAF